MHYNAFFQHRLGEVQRNMERIRDQVDILEPLHKVASRDNPADLCTKSEAGVSELQPGGLWQAGPHFLTLPRDQWEITIPDEEGHIPTNEIKGTCNQTQARIGAPQLRSVIREMADNTRKLSVLIGAVARLFNYRLSAGKKELHHSPSLEERRRAEKAIQWAFSPEVDEAVKEGKLESLNPHLKNGLWVTSGRLRKLRLVELTGKEEMTIIMAESRLGQLYLIACHEEDHRLDTQGILARSRKAVWLVGARRVARRVARSCTWCRKLGKTTSTQIMGKLSPHLANQAPPFAAVALDLFGPLMATGVGGHSRKVFKTWGLVFSCFSSKAVSLWLAAGYSKDDFMICFDKQTAVYGLPALVVSDRGTQLVAAEKEIGVMGELQEDMERLGTKWEFIPPGCQWRNGAAERSVAMAKHTLQQVISSYETLSFTELDAVLLRVAAILNERPLDARLYNDDTFHPVCPRDLLLGRISGYAPSVKLDWNLEPNLGAHWERIARLVLIWWDRWEEQAFPLMCPRQKWTKEQRNLKEGDIVLLKYDKKLGKPDFRLAKVVRTMPDEDGVVRTVEIAMRSRRGRSREKPGVCLLPMEKATMAVQRLVVLLPVEECWARGLAH